MQTDESIRNTEAIILRSIINLFRRRTIGKSILLFILENQEELQGRVNFDVEPAQKVSRNAL
jgi:hypothetical protein